ncbi:MAG: phosphoglycerate dehydrogenase [Anaerolineae bacterium]
MTDKILVTTRSFRKVEGRHQQMLLDAGYEIVNSPYDRPATGDELAEMIGGVVAAILGVDEVSEKAIAAGKHLKVLSRFGVGVDSVDVAAATRHGVPVTITPGANSIAVAELTLALMLTLSRRVAEFGRAAQHGSWSPLPGWELSGSTLGVMGMGRIGREVARRAAAFDMTILFYDPFPPPADFVAQVNCQSVSIEALLERSDFITLHLPLSEETHHLLNAARLVLCKPTAYLINTARGGLVDETALCDALMRGTLAGAAFDVFEQEPPTGSPLLALPNFVAMPHAGSATRQTTQRMGVMAAENALMMLRGERPPESHIVNPEVFGR